MRRILVVPICVSIVVLTTLVPRTPVSAAGTWSAAASMSQARGAHTATLLPDGTVLVEGGYNGSTLNTAELYNPSTDVWIATGSMATPRYNHTATLLPNGKVLVTGGQNDGPSPIASAELYDPAAHTWTSAPDMSTARFSHSATLLTNGKVLVVGGYNIASAELYDPTANLWAPAASMATQRRLHTATLLADGQVLVAGGVNCLPCVAVSSAEVYNANSDSWSMVGALNAARYQHTASLLPSGQVLIAGGWYGGGTYDSAEIYDPLSHSWALTNSMSTKRLAQTATVLPNHSVLVVGGGFTDASSDVASAEIFDPTTHLWSSAGTMAAPRINHTATLLADGRVVVVGGGTLSTSYTDTADIVSGLGVAALADPSLVAYWNFDEGSGTTVADESSNGHTGTVVNGANWVTGHRGSALELDGISQYVSIPPLFSVTPSALSISAWFLAPTTGGTIIYNGATAENELLAGPGGLSFGVKLSNSQWYGADYAPTPTPSQWHFLVGVWDQGGYVRLYLDGLLAAQQAVPNIAPLSYFGQRIGAYAPVDSQFFGGAIDELKVYDRALSASEISTAYCDVDGDAVCDLVDNCPATPNADQSLTRPDFIDLHVYGKAFDDTTVLNSTTLGDACNPDIDGDEFANSTEDALGPSGASHAQCPGATATTDPTKLDTDGDGVTDRAECMLGTDPTNAASKPPTSYTAGDTDHDGLPDTLEVTLGTDPSKPDTDGDKLNDGVEFLYYGSDPLNPNTDGDICTDGKEAASLNADTIVNSTDQLIAAQSFGPKTGPKYVLDFDVNRDERINSTDMLIQAKVYGPC